MLSVRIGLVDTTKEIGADVMSAAAAAINVQVTRDLPQFWPVNATVAYLPDPHDIPQGVWPVKLVKSLPPGTGGYHQTSHNQPYAKVIVTPNSTEWVVDASHETIEMLVDPNGNRLQTSTSIGISADGKSTVDTDGRFEYLVEACDPCEADPYTYQIDGLSVSDFITPHFYDPQPTPGARFSFTGAIKTPRQILPGGYISWVDPQSNEIQQIVWLGAEPKLRTLGPATGLSLRLFVDGKTHPEVMKHRKGPSPEALASREAYRTILRRNGEMRARHYQ